MKNKKIFVLIFTILFIVMLSIPKTLSKFSSTLQGDAIGSIAFYVIDLGLQNTEINLEEISPRSEDYVYDFSVANYNDTKQLETNAVYNVTIRTTTNLNLQYKLYKNGVEEDIFISNEIIKDEDGTYFRIMKANSEYFSFKEKEKNEYQLFINFPEEYKGYDYQGIIESIEIIVDSSQIIE